MRGPHLTSRILNRLRIVCFFSPLKSKSVPKAEPSAAATGVSTASLKCEMFKWNMSTQQLIPKPQKHVLGRMAKSLVKEVGFKQPIS